MIAEEIGGNEKLPHEDASDRRGVWIKMDENGKQGWARKGRQSRAHKERAGIRSSE